MSGVYDDDGYVGESEELDQEHDRADEEKGEARPLRAARPKGGRPMEARPTGGRPMEARPTGGRPMEAGDQKEDEEEVWERPCWFYQVGRCARSADECNFAHVMEPLVEPVASLCNFFNSRRGCRYGDECDYVHVVDDGEQVFDVRQLSSSSHVQASYGGPSQAWRTDSRSEGGDVSREDKRRARRRRRRRRRAAGWYNEAGDDEEDETGDHTNTDNTGRAHGSAPSTVDTSNPFAALR